MLRSRLGSASGALLPLAVALSLCHTKTSSAVVGYPLLLLEPEARSASRGESALALREGLEGFFQQPAATAWMDDEALAACYVDHVQDIQALGTCWATPRPAPWVLGAGVLRLDYGRLGGLDESGEGTGDFDAGETLLLVGAARRLPDWGGGRLAAGAQAGLILGSIADASSSAWLASAGAAWRRGQLSLGAAARNLGQVISDYGAAKGELPATVEAGAAWRLAHLPFTWSLGWQKIRGRDAFAKVGGEFLIAGRWRLDAGYHVERGDERIAGADGESGRGFSLGVGGALPHGLDLQWGWSSYGALGSLNRLSLTWRYRQ
jgi:hypothetical protein